VVNQTAFASLPKANLSRCVTCENKLVNMNASILLGLLL